jgi:undecaprenyl-diphosphatase
LLAIAAASAGTYVSAAVSLMGAAGRRLEIGRTTAAQVASAFTNRLAPAGLGGMTTNVQYLRAAGSTRAEAITAVGLNSMGGFIVHLTGVAAIVPLLGAGHTHLRVSGPELPDRWPYLVVAVAVFGLVGLVRWWAVVRRKVAPVARATLAALRASIGKPRTGLTLLLGAAGITSCYTLALAAACQAFGVGLPLTTITAVFLGGSAVAAAAPTPGGLGALEAALVAGLTAAGASSGPAIAAVLVYRLVTYWLPVIPGGVAYHLLRKSGSL